MSDVSDNLSHRNFSARLTVETFFRTCSAQMCGKRGLTRATGKTKYPRQDSNFAGTFLSVVFSSVSQTRYCVSPLFYKVSTKNSESNTNHLHTFCTHVFKHNICREQMLCSPQVLILAAPSSHPPNPQPRDRAAVAVAA